PIMLWLRYCTIGSQLLFPRSSSEVSRSMTLKQIAWEVTPPILWRFLRKLIKPAEPVPGALDAVSLPVSEEQPREIKPVGMFSGDYSSFSEAASHSVGYNSDEPASAAASQLRNMLQTAPSTEIDGRFQQVHSALCVVRDRMQMSGLSVMDIGGGGGNYFF